MTSKPVIYHEKQVKELCALHALNNLFQTRGMFSKSLLDSICSKLSPNVWVNPHRSMLGLGNYDINVIMAALQQMGYEAIWFDKRKDPGCLNLSNISGFILNVPSDYKIGFVMLPIKRRHWITVRQIQGSFYNLDSKLETPSCIGKSSELISYLKEQLDSKDKELFVVVTKEVEEKQAWICKDIAQNCMSSTLGTYVIQHQEDSPTESASLNSNYDFRYRSEISETVVLEDTNNSAMNGDG